MARVPLATLTHAGEWNAEWNGDAASGFLTLHLLS